MRIAIVAEGDFSRNNRLLKLARSLTERGHAVARFGIRADESQHLHESTDVGEIILTVTGMEDLAADGPARGRRGSDIKLGVLTAVKRAAVRFGPANDLRHYFGRRRECSLLYDTVRSWQPDAVICVNPPMMRVGAWAQREIGALFIYDAQEIWVEMYPRSRRVMRALYSWLERRLAWRCDLVLTVNDEIADLMARRMGIERPMVLMNGASECLAPTPVHTPLRVLFQGSFAADRGLIPMIEQMHHLRGRAVFTLQGFGEMGEAGRRTVEALGIGDVVRFVEPCDPSEVISAANEHDLGLIVWPLSNDNLVFASPNKLFDYIGAGLALLAIDAPVLRRFVTTTGCGVLITEDEFGEAWKVVASLAEDTDQVWTMKTASHELCPSLLWDVCVQPLLEWLDSRGASVHA